MSSLNSRGGWKFGTSRGDSRRSQTGTGTDLGAYTSSNLNGPALNEPRLVCDISSVDYDSKDLEQGCYIQQVQPPLPIKNSRRFLPSIKQPSSVLRLKNSTCPEVFVHVESHQSPDEVVSSESRMTSPVRSLECQPSFEQAKPRALKAGEEYINPQTEALSSQSEEDEVQIPGGYKRHETSV
ncbi:hypothetical protein BJ165DRAFT_1140086 [Panaeolus papilionaceus]|nr:hypothetical protein BJ165DRAFT_1140086 [Panaeolus papilionaceus]